MTARHVIRFGRNGWRCSCRTVGRSTTAAEQHAFDTQGRIELGRSA